MRSKVVAGHVLVILLVLMLGTMFYPAAVAASNAKGEGLKKAIYFQHSETGLIEAWVVDGFTLLEEIEIGPSPGPAWRVVAVHDFDGSGSPDLFWQSTFGRLAVWVMDEFQIKEQVPLTPEFVNPNFLIVDLHDMNADGSPDIIFQNPLWGNRNVWFMKGLEQQSGRPFAVAGKSWNIVGVEDMGGDGKTNIIFEHLTDGRRNYWTLDENLERIADQSGEFRLTGTSWSLKAVHDMTGDGSPDIILQHNSEGSRNMWIMGGTRGMEILEGGNIATKDIAWNIVGAGTVGTAPSLPAVTAVAELAALEVEHGTLFSALDLPETVTVSLEDGSTLEVAVDWSASEALYDGQTSGHYELAGLLVLPHGIINPDEHKAHIAVTVGPAPDKSGFSVLPPGSQNTDQRFNLEIIDARDYHGALLNGEVLVTVESSEEGKLFHQVVTFAQGEAQLELMAKRHGFHRLTVSLAAVTKSEDLALRVRILALHDELRTDEDKFLVRGQFLPQPNPLGLASFDFAQQVHQVVLIYSDRYEMLDVEGSSFVIDMRRGQPGGMAFVDREGNFLAHLDLGNGFGSIPAQAVGDAVYNINLQEITIEDNKALPGHNPLGKEIKISENDLSAVAVAGSFFSAVAMSPGFVESMTKDERFIYIYNLYDTRFPGKKHFDRRGNIIDNLNLKLVCHLLHFAFDPPYDNFGNLRLTYPRGLDLWVQDNPGYHEWMTGDFIAFPPVGDDDHGVSLTIGPTIPEAGEYRLYDPAAGGLDVSFALPELKQATEDNFVAPRPKVHLDEDGIIVKAVSWEYYTLEGRKIDHPENIMTKMSLRLFARSNDPDKLIGDYDSIRDNIIERHSLYEIYDLEIEADNYFDLETRINDPFRVIGDTDYDIYWDDVGVIHLDYYDVYGMVYSVHYGYRDENPVYHLDVTVEPHPGGIVTPRRGYYAQGEQVTLVARPNIGWEFTGWLTDDVTVEESSSAEISFLMPAKNVSITANFKMTDDLETYEISFSETNSLPEVKIDIFYDEASTESIAVLLPTDAQGRTSGQLPNGAYIFRASLKGYEIYESAFTVDGVDKELSFTLTKPPTDRTVTFAEANSLSEVEVRIFSTAETAKAVTAADLAVQITVVVPGVFNVSIAYEQARQIFENLSDKRALLMSIEGKEALVLTYNAAQNAFFKAAVQGYSEEEILNAAVTMDAAPAAVTHTGPDGEAVVTLKEGPYRYSAHREGYLTHEEEFLVGGGDKRLVFTLEVHEISYHEVSFVETGGLAELKLSIYEDEPSSDALATLTTGEDGRATLELPDGDYRYSAELPGYAAQHGTFKISGEAKEIAFTYALIETDYSLTINTDGPGQVKVSPAKAAEELEITIDQVVPGVYNIAVSYEHAQENFTGLSPSCRLILYIEGKTPVYLTYSAAQIAFFHAALQGYTPEEIRGALVAKDCPEDQAVPTFNYADKAILIATAEEDAAFSHYSGDFQGTAVISALTMTDSKEITAYFRGRPAAFTFTLSAVGNDTLHFTLSGLVDQAGHLFTADMIGAGKLFTLDYDRSHALYFSGYAAVPATGLGIVITPVLPGVYNLSVAYDRAQQSFAGITKTCRLVFIVKGKDPVYLNYNAAQDAFSIAALQGYTQEEIASAMVTAETQSTSLAGPAFSTMGFDEQSFSVSGAHEFTATITLPEMSVQKGGRAYFLPQWLDFLSILYEISSYEPTLEATFAGENITLTGERTAFNKPADLPRDFNMAGAMVFVRGAVRDQNNRPLEGAAVTVWSAYDYSLNYSRARISDSAGNYNSEGIREVYLPAEEAYTIYAFKYGYHQAKRENISLGVPPGLLQASATQPSYENFVDLSLEEIAAQHTLTFEEASGLEGVSISVSYNTTQMGRSQTMPAFDLTTGLDGRAVFPAAVDGSHRFTARKQGYQPYEGSFDLAGEDLLLTFALVSLSDPEPDKKHAVTFREENNLPAVEIKIYTDAASTDTVEAVLRTDENGTATTLLADGTYWYAATLQGYERYEGTFTLSGEAKTINFSMKQPAAREAVPFPMEQLSAGETVRQTKGAPYSGWKSHFVRLSQPTHSEP